MVSPLRYVLLVVGGFTAAVVLAAPEVRTYLDFGPDPVFASEVAAVAAGSVVAMLTATGCRRRSHVVAATLVGAALVALVALPGAWRFDMYPATIGAGLLLGGLTVLCRGPQQLWRQSALAGAAVAGLVSATPIAEYRTFAAASPGSARYLEASVQPLDPLWLVLALVTAVTVLAALPAGAIDTGSDGTEEIVRQWNIRELVVGVGLPAVAIVLYWSFDRALYTASPDGPGRWLLGVLVVPIVIGAALWLRARTGTVLLAAAALFVSFRSAEAWLPGAWPTLLIPLFLAAAGVWLARRYPKPLLGIGVLAFTAATAIFERAPWDNAHFVATIFVVPLAAAFTIVASLPSTAPVTATSLTLPAMMSLPLMVEFGWTAYTPLTDPDRAPSGFPEATPSAWTMLSVGVSVTSVIACGIAMVWLRRRELNPPAADRPR